MPLQRLCACIIAASPNPTFAAGRSNKSQGKKDKNRKISSSSARCLPRKVTAWLGLERTPPPTPAFPAASASSLVPRGPPPPAPKSVGRAARALSAAIPIPHLHVVRARSAPPERCPLMPTAMGPGGPPASVEQPRRAGAAMPPCADCAHQEPVPARSGAAAHVPRRATPRAATLPPPPPPRYKAPLSPCKIPAGTSNSTAKIVALASSRGRICRAHISNSSNFFFYLEEARASLLVAGLLQFARYLIQGGSITSPTGAVYAAPCARGRMAETDSDDDDDDYDCAPAA
ncbi:hypothetical protein HU200_036714 [Digitaria exilis]|uniref:Uncharacterized protein n=1 Tax=Digitaria exilis TaxID=1010633 RepID=A0A835EK57_9POAL|nr:hypothetical protein HU200_036714 [Digitaria exilis]